MGTGVSKLHFETAFRFLNSILKQCVASEKILYTLV